MKMNFFYYFLQKNEQQIYFLIGKFIAKGISSCRDAFLTHGIRRSICLIKSINIYQKKESNVNRIKK